MKYSNIILKKNLLLVTYLLCSHWVTKCNVGRHATTNKENLWKKSKLEGTMYIVQTCTGWSASHPLGTADSK